jgi:hypothetical protein
MQTLKQRAIAAVGAIVLTGFGVASAAAADIPVAPGPYYGEYAPPAPVVPPAPIPYGYPPPVAVAPPGYYAPPVVVVPAPYYPRRYVYGVRPYPSYYGPYGYDPYVGRGYW